MEIMEAGLAGDQEIISLRRQIHLIQRMRFGAMCALGIPVLLWFLKVLNPLWLTAILGGLLLTLFLIGGLKGGQQKCLERRRNAHLDKHSVSLQQEEDRDICHREQEGPGHARINPRRRKKPNAAM